jgi:replicative DNA helicase
VNDQTPPPFDLAAERALIGLVLADSRADFDACAKLRPEAMYSEAHRRTWKAILDMLTAERVPDIIQLRAQLKRNGDLPVVDDGVLSSFRQEEANFSFGHATEYIRIVSDLAKSRAMIAALQRALAMGYSGTLDTEEFIRRAQGEVEAASRLEDGEFRPRFVTDVVKSELAKLKAAGGEEVPVAISGLAALDKDVRICEGNLVIIGARPGMGKSALAEHFATATGESLFCSLEMPDGEYARRTMAHASGVPFLRAVARMQEFGSRFGAAFDAVGKKAIQVVDQPSITIADLRAFIRQARRELLNRGKRLKLVVLDYLQLMTALSGKKGETRDQEVGGLTKALKGLAKREKIAVVLLAQLGRDAEKAERPAMSHLRESGNIEQDADKVLLLYRQNYYDKKDLGDVEPAEIIVAKDRQGKPGVIHVGWRGEVTSFVDLETEEYA